METTYVIVGVVALVLSAAAIGILIRSKLARLVLDRPNERSMHVTPTPRFGGFVVVVVACGFVALPALREFRVVGLVALALAVLSLIDDIRSLPANLRFGSHVAAAAVVLVAFWPPFWWMAPLLVLALVWLANLYNFMDGMDGFAGGMAVIGFGCYALAAGEAADAALAMLSLAIASASLGFLFWNFPPAKVFMGDGGAVPLGFLAACLGYIGMLRGDWPWWFGPLVFSPFIVDASVTLVRRIVRREILWQAHATHYYQRMARTGFGHTKTTLLWYGVMLASSATSLVLRGRPDIVVATAALAWALIYGLALLWVDRTWRAHQMAQ